MHKYILQGCRLDEDGHVQKALWQEEIWADNDPGAIKQARIYQICLFVDNTDYAWLTDRFGSAIWEISVNERHLVRDAGAERAS